MAKIEQQHAFVLHSRDYTDSRVLIDVFTRDFGRISTAFRLSAARRRASRVQPFTPCLVSYYGNSALKTLTQLEAVAGAYLFTGKSLYCGMYLNELLQHVLVAEDPYPSVYDAYKNCLKALAVVVAGEEDIPLRQFELVLLAELGYGINFDSDISGSPISPSDNVHYAYEPADGFAPTGGVCGDTYSGQVLCSIGSGKWRSDDCRRAAKRLCRAAISELLGGKSLVSRALFSHK